MVFVFAYTTKSKGAKHLIIESYWVLTNKCCSNVKLRFQTYAGIHLYMGTYMSHKRFQNPYEKKGLSIVFATHFQDVQLTDSCGERESKRARVKYIPKGILNA